MEEDFKGALQKVKHLGYGAVELLLSPYSGGEVKQYMKKWESFEEELWYY